VSFAEGEFTRTNVPKNRFRRMGSPGKRGKKKTENRTKNCKFIAKRLKNVKQKNYKQPKCRRKRVPLVFTKPGIRGGGEEKKGGSMLHAWVVGPKNESDHENGSFFRESKTETISKRLQSTLKKQVHEKRICQP